MTTDRSAFIVEGRDYLNQTRADAARRSLAAKKEREAAALAAGKPLPAPKPKAPRTPPPRRAPDPKGVTKNGIILAMLNTPEGATSKAMETATGWTGNSVRGLLGTLRKDGVNLVSTKVQGSPTVYRIVRPVVADPGDVV